MSTFDFRSLLLLALFVIYGLGYVIVGLLNVQSPWAASFFKVPFLFALFGARIGRILAGLVSIAGGVWFFTLLN